MARKRPAPPDQIRVVFRTAEAERFLRGWEAVPNHGGTDPLNLALQQSFAALERAFPGIGEYVELSVEPAPWLRDSPSEWYAVNFAVPHEDVREASHDPDAVSEWIAEFTPDLVFAIEDETGRPIRKGRTRSRIPDTRAMEAGLGRPILTGIAAFTAASGFLADWNRTHLFNPRWTPHAKFHDAWTILLGTSLGSTALYLLWRRRPDPAVSALLLAQFWAAQAGSFAFPGAAGVTKEFRRASSRRGLAKIPEGVASAAMLALTGLGYLLERRRLRRSS